MPVVISESAELKVVDITSSVMFVIIIYWLSLASITLQASIQNTDTSIGFGDHALL